jgi:subtilisin-like proprotein convertase family protein
MMQLHSPFGGQGVRRKRFEKLLAQVFLCSIHAGSPVQLPQNKRMRNKAIYTTICFLLLGGLPTLWAQGVPVLSNPSNCNLNLTITDNNCPDGQVFFSPNLFRINVTNAGGTRLGDNVFLKEVRLIIRHSWVGDLDIRLIAPSGKSIDLSSDNGGVTDNYGNPDTLGCGIPMVFSAAGCKKIDGALAPFLDGPYQPEESFFLFNDGITNPNGQWTLQICDDSPEDEGMLEYVELRFESLSCLPISNVNILGIDTTTVRLAWQPDNCNPVIIEYGAPGFVPGTGAQAGQGTLAFANACSPYTLQGLQPFTEYDLYVRRSCNLGSNFSDNSCVARFKTSCLPPPATIVENFDSYNNCSSTCGAVCDFPGIWRNAGGDDFDWIVFQGATPTVSTGPNGDVNSGSGKYLYLEASGTACTNGKQTFLLSNCIRINKRGTDSCHLSFNYHMFGTDMGTLRLQYSTDGGAAWTTMWERTGNQGDAWYKTYLSLNQFPDSSIVRFRFVGIGGKGPRGDMALDHIVFFGSEDLGVPDTPFYADADGDGYGNPNQFLLTCLEEVPPGYTLIGGDCDDTNPAINPGALESPCNGVDDNCNGNADENILPAPLTTGDTVCSGALGQLLATPGTGRPVFWYASPTGDDVLQNGNVFFPSLPENNSPAPVLYRFYAEESDFVCRSDTRAEAVVVVNPRPNVRHTETPSICPSDSFDLLSLNIQDANFTGSTITFHSGTPATAANRLSKTMVSPMTTTTYYYLATSPDRCTDENSVTVFVKPAPELSFAPAKIFGLCQDDAGTVTVTASKGAGNYRYQWSTGDTDNNIEVRAGATVGMVDQYTLVVTDAAGCSVRDTVTVTTTNSIDSVRVTTRDVTSCGGRNGNFVITPLGGRAPFSYRWRSNNGTLDSVQNVSAPVSIDNLRQGAYRITITDSSPQGCEIVLRQVLINGPSAIVETPQLRDVSCPGANDGAITLRVIGGNPTYRWSNGATTAGLQNISGGTYAVTITDGMCETVLGDLNIAEPEPLKTARTLREPDCAESTDGSIDLTTFGGTKNYSFLWNTGSRREDLENVAAGTYRVTITDAKGCQLVDSIRLNAPPVLSIQTDSLQNVSCKNRADGYLKVQATGGTAPYRYEWNTGSFSSVLPNLNAGNYTVTVTDFKGCQRITNLAISQPDSLQINLLSQNNPRCNGENNGLLNLNAQGGTAPYRFSWSTGATGATLPNLGVGTYSVTLTDAQGCPGGSASFQLTATSPISVALAKNEPSCVGRQDGAISVQPTGSAPFRYRWSGGDSTQILTNVGVGTYAVTVQDAQGCRYDTSVTVRAPQAFELNLGVSQPSCNGSADGIILVNFFRSGTPPLTYNWSNGSTTKDLMNLRQGNYVLTLTDAQGCRLVSDTVEIRNPPVLQLLTKTVGSIACKSDSTGFIETAALGGTPPYRYNWVGLNKTEADIYNLPGGNYRLVVQDANNCPIDTSFRLVEPPELLADVDVTISGDCAAQYSNELRARVSGGRAPYTYLWSNGSKDSILVNVPADDYELSVTDANNCTRMVSSIKVRGSGTALAIDTVFVKDISCNGLRDGEMTVRVAGGSPPFQFHFSNNVRFDTTAREVTISNLPLNTNYRVTVTDLSSTCTVVSPALLVDQPQPLSYIFDSLSTPKCFSGSDGEINASTYGGKAPYSYRWYNASNVLVGTTEDLKRVPNGIYTGVAIDNNGCLDTMNQKIVIQNNSDLIRISQTVVQNVKCKGDRSGAIDVTIAGGQPPYDFRWSNNRFTEDITALPAGAYGLTVTDDNACRVIFTAIPVTEPAAKLEINGKMNDVTCFGEANGSIEVAVNGGTPPYELIWEYQNRIFTQDTNVLTQLRAGTYTLVVRDTNQCTQTAPFEVKQPQPLVINILQNSNANSVTAQASGGTPNYSYLWSTGDTTQTLNYSANGTYTVSVTDARGCDTSAIAMPVSAVQEVAFVANARFYPNPTAGNLTLELKLYEPLEVVLEIWNAVGQRVENQHLGNIQNLQLPLDLNTQPAGLYQLTLLAQGRRVSLGKVLLVKQ